MFPCACPDCWRGKRTPVLAQVTDKLESCSSVVKFRVQNVAYFILGLGTRMEATELLHDSWAYWQLCLQGLCRLFPKVCFSVLALHPALGITWVALSGVSYMTLDNSVQLLSLSSTDSGYFLVLLWVLVSRQNCSLVCVSFGSLPSLISRQTLFTSFYQSPSVPLGCS